MSPAASEVCDSVDNNCDGVTDTDATDLKTYYADADGDGSGDPSVTSLACSRPTGFIGNKKVNVQGGGIALGHPLGATGARLMTTLLNALERTGGRYGLQTMCEGGGQANVTIIERL